MPKISLTQIKASFGYRPRAHLKTILRDQKAALKKYTYPGMTETGLKKLFVTLQTASAAQRAALRKDAFERTRAYKEGLLDERKRQAALERARRREARHYDAYVVGDFDDKQTGPYPWQMIKTLLGKYRGRYVRITAHSGSRNTIVRDYADDPCNLARGELHCYDLNKHNIVNAHRNIHKPMERCLQRCADSGQPVVNDESNESNESDESDDSDRYRRNYSATGDYKYKIPAKGSTKQVFDKLKAVFDWVLTYNDANRAIVCGKPVSFLHPGDEIRVHEITEVEALDQPVQQRYREGNAHCLIRPILNYMLNLYDTAKTKQTRCNYNGAIKKLRKAEETYEHGISDEEIQELIDDVSKNTKINVHITQPIASSIEKKFRNAYNTGKVFELKNTRLHHVDVNALTLQMITMQGKNRDYSWLKDVTSEEIVQIKDALVAEGMHCEWKVGSQGISRLWTCDTVYRTRADFRVEVDAFTHAAGILGLRIDANADEELTAFLREGTHYCTSAVFDCNPPEDGAGVECYDIHKSYATFKDCRFYDECKFPNKITCFAPTDRVRGPGLYKIVDVDFSGANKKFTQLHEKMGRPFQSDNIYAVPWLKLMDSYGVKYRVVFGAWAGGAQDTFDLRFSSEIVEKKYYAELVGAWNSIKYTDSYFMHGTKEMAQNIKTYLKNKDGQTNVYWHRGEQVQKLPDTGDADVVWHDTGGEIEIEFPKKRVWHLSQFTAYINAYEGCRMFDQLMQTDLDKLIQVQKDDFLCYKHEFKLHSSFRKKTAALLDVDPVKGRKYENKVALARSCAAPPVDDEWQPELCYLSNITPPELKMWFTPEIEDRFMRRLRKFQKRFECVPALFEQESAPVRVYRGPGGTGKTDAALRDPRLVGKLYVAPTWLLASTKARDYKLSTEGHDEAEAYEESVKSAARGKQKTATFMSKNLKLQVAVDRRLTTANREIWERFADASSTLVIDEISMMSQETINFILTRFPTHQIVLCGDPGYQLPAFSTPEQTVTPLDLNNYNFPIVDFDFIHRLKCENLRAVRAIGRQMITDGRKQAIPDRDLVKEMAFFYKSRCRCVDSMEEVASLYEAFSYDVATESYQPKDMIVCGTNNIRKIWTDYLAPQQPYDADGKQIQKWMTTITKGEYCNGDVIVATTPPSGFEVMHASTVHKAQGQTARGRVFIYEGDLWDKTHWETAVGRATRLEDVVIITADVTELMPKTEYNFYKISSAKANKNYIGLTTQTLKERKRGHESELNTCTSKLLTKYDDCEMTLLETRLCTSLKDAEARENYWISQTPNCVNKRQLSKNSGPYLEMRKEYFDGENLAAIVKFVKTMPTTSMSEKIFRDYVLAFNAGVLHDDAGGAYVLTTYRRRACGGRRCSIARVQNSGTDKRRAHSLQGMYSALRCFLLGRFCHDVDIVNSIPTILTQIAEMDAVPADFCQTLNFYIRNRDDCLRKIVEHHFCAAGEELTEPKYLLHKGAAKEAVIRTYNGGSFAAWARDEKVSHNKNTPAAFLKNLYEEIEGMKKHLLGLKKYKKIRRACVKFAADGSKDEAASDRSAFATICFDKEDKILSAIEASLKDAGWRTETLIYDGLPVWHRDDACLEVAMRNAEKHVKKKTGFHIQLLEKPMYQENLTIQNVIDHIKK